MKHTVVLIVASALVLLSACTRTEQALPGIDPTSVRSTKSGPVVGFVGEYGSHAWLGIPYAKAPTGSLRWRAPQPPESWQDTRQALRFGSPCVQYASAFGGVTTEKPGTPVGSEDCLYLNIWAPKNAQPDSRLPVMLWIHGGGNTIGEGGFYNGGRLAEAQDVIVLTFNYRLGPLGWFRHAALAGESGSELDRSGNFGTLDMVRALEWVRDNIAVFGGDRGNVTIFGESAGGQNVFQLLLSPVAKGLFHRAIVQSGGLTFNSNAEAENFHDAEEPGDANSSNEALLRLLVTDGRAKDRDAAKSVLAAMPSREVAQYLRRKSGFDFLAAYPQFLGTGMIRVPKPFRDGVVLPTEDPMLAFAGGRYHQVPVMLGTNRDENKVFMFGNPQRVRKLLWLLPRVRDQRSYDLSAEYMSKSWKASGADEPAAVMRGVQGASVYVYRFDWDEEPTILGSDLSTMLGAAHGFEIPFVFGHFNLGSEGNQIFTKDNEPGRLALAAQMMSYWSNFAYTGSPGQGRDGQLPEWQAWDPSSPAAPKYLVLDTPAGGGLRMASETYTTKSVLAAVATDARLSSAIERCRIYREIADWGRGFGKAEYAATPGCGSYPYDAYPWEQ